MAKGTALRGCSDADLVVFLSCFSQFAEQGNRRAEIISEIRAQLEACQRKMQFEVKFEIPKWENSRVLSFSLTSQTMLDQSVDFDVLPAFNALGEVPRHSPEKGRSRVWAARDSIRGCAMYKQTTPVHSVGLVHRYVYQHSPAKCLEKRLPFSNSPTALCGLTEALGWVLISAVART